jgi:hypothetical protein
MAALSLLRSGLVASVLFAGVFVAGCAAADAEDDGSTAQELGFGNGHGNGDHGDHGGDHGGPGGPGGGGDHGNHGDNGHEGGGIHGPHHGGHGAGQHIPGGHFGQHGPETVTPPQDVYFASISANGTGCPDGSWDVGISDDGQTFTLAFSAYEAQLDVGQAVDMKDCTLAINLASKTNATAGLSFAVASFYYQGYILLDQGMVGRQTASYYFDEEGDHGEHDQSQNNVPGPFDNSYLFQNDVAPGRQVWSRCGASDTLHIKTQIMLRNNPQNSGEGYINNSTVDGSLSFKWALNWRHCDGGGN